MQNHHTAHHTSHALHDQLESLLGDLQAVKSKLVDVVSPKRSLASRVLDTIKDHPFAAAAAVVGLGAGFAVVVLARRR